MHDYRPNSHKYKEEQKNATSDEKRVKNVIKGVATVKKKNGFRKLTDTFISEDAGGIKDYIVNDMIVPTVKKTIVGVVDMLLNGGRSTYNDRFSDSKVSYRKFYDEPRDNRGRSSERTRFDYDELQFNNRGSAEAVLDEMYNILDRYTIVTVADMYDIVDVSPPFTSHKYGWTNLRGADVMRVGNKYVIKLPKAMPID